jgi:tRNA(His) 5'-end guanylyltransferase
MHTLWQLRKEGLISEEQKGEIKGLHNISLEDLMILNASFVLQMYSEFVQKGVCCLRELILRHLKGEKYHLIPIQGYCSTIR